jgi:hypothetical protein
MSAVANKRTPSSIPASRHPAGTRRPQEAASVPEPRGSLRRWPFYLLAAAALAGLFLIVGQALKQPPAPKKVAATADDESSHHATDPTAVAPMPLVEPAKVPTTEAVLTTRGASCLDCAKQNGCLDPDKEGGSCEEAHGYATACGQGVTEKAMCLKILSEIFTSKCAETLQQVPCLCGTADAEACLAGMETPNGPLYREYQCSFNTSDVGAIQAKFRDPTYGAGQANALVQCLAGFNCDCFSN